MTRALLLGRRPDAELGFEYVSAAPYDAVVIGSLTLGQLLCFREEQTLNALAQGKQVVLYTPGLPSGEQNRALSGAVAAARRELKSWGVVFSDGAKKRLITAEEARQMRRAGLRPGPGAVLTPLAREILEGSE